MQTLHCRGILAYVSYSHGFIQEYLGLWALEIRSMPYRLIKRNELLPHHRDLKFLDISKLSTITVH